MKYYQGINNKTKKTMKYLIKIIAHIPALCVGISTVFCFLLLKDLPYTYPIYVGNLFAFVYLYTNVDNIEMNINDLIKVLKNEYNKGIDRKE